MADKTYTSIKQFEDQVSGTDTEFLVSRVEYLRQRVRDLEAEKQTLETRVHELEGMDRLIRRN